MLRDNQDAYGHELLAHLDGIPATEIIERDDGFVDTSSGPAAYFADADTWTDWERQAMTYVRGRVLDIGSGAGRHALYLQDRRHDVVCIDNSPLALEVCRRRGVKDTRPCPITQVGPQLGMFDTILMWGNNFGLLASRKQAPRLLKRFARITTPDGRIVAQTNNPYATTDPAHLAYHERNRKRGRMPGQIRLRVRYNAYCTPWFDYLMVSPEEMAEIVAETPWRIGHILGEPAKGGYAAVLEKP